MKTLLFLSFLLMVVRPDLSAQDKITETIFVRIYNMEYAAADSLIKVHRQDIDPYYLAVLEIDKSYWKNVTGTNEPDFVAFESTLKKYEKAGEKNTEQQAIMLIKLSYQLRYEIKRFHLIDAAFTRKKTMDLFEQLKDRSPELSREQQELLVLYKALILYFDNYFKPFFVSSKKANMQLALSDMERMANSENTIVKTLAAYFVGRTWLKFEKESARAERYFCNLSDNYPGNTRFAEYLAECREENR